MTALYTDLDPYCCRVLRARVADGGLPHGDVLECPIEELGDAQLRGRDQIHLFAGIGGFPLGFKWAGLPDDFSVVTGGFPCQDLSIAGKGAGLGGSRSGLWWQMLRIVRLARPRWVVVENVAALLGRGLGAVVGPLAESGYRVEWDCIPASAVGAPHQRDRVWIVGHLASERCRQGRQGRAAASGERGLPARDAANTKRQRCKGRGEAITGTAKPPSRSQESDWWSVEPDVGRVADGIPKRVDRLRSLGNAIVPQIAELIGLRIKETP